MNPTDSGKNKPLEPGPAQIDSGVLLGIDGRVLITHRGQTYVLRETRQGKLILTK